METKNPLIRATADTIYSASGHSHDDRYYTEVESSGLFAPAASGVTGGNTHDHNGGDGAQISHDYLSNVTATQHHSNSNDPTSGQKDALAGTSGTPSSTNKYVTNDDSRNTNARTPTTHDNTQHSATYITQDGNARVAVKKAGSGVGTRRGINFIEGSNVTLTVADDSGNEEVDVTVAASFSSPVYDAETDFGFVGDLRQTWDGACNSGTPTKITSASMAFTAADLNKRITLAGAGSSAAMYAGTITNIDSTTQVTVSPNVSTTVSSKAIQVGTDNTNAITAMQNAVNNATYRGATIIFGRSATNRYGFPTNVTFTKPVQIEGIGGGHTADVGDYIAQTGGTALAWWGTTSDGGTPFQAFITIAPDVASGMAIKRVALRHIWLDCRNGDQAEAVVGLKMTSCHGAMIEDFFINDPGAIGMWTDIDSDPGEAKDFTRFTMHAICIRCLDSCSNPSPTLTPTTTSTAITLSTSGQSMTIAAANGLTTSGYFWTMTSIGQPCLVYYSGGGGTTTLTGCRTATEFTVNTPTTVSGSNVVQANPSNSCAIYWGGGTGANSCCGTVDMVQISHGTTWGPAAIEFANCDSIALRQIMCNGGSGTNDGAINRIRKPGVRFNGSNTSDTLASRNNHFVDGDPGAGGCSVMGLTNAGARLTYMPTANYWDLMQMGNGAPVPNVEVPSSPTGATGPDFDWTPNGGMRPGARGGSSISDQSIAAATTALVAGSQIFVPPQGWQIGTTFRWQFVIDKTAAGTASSSVLIKIGTAGTTSDATVCTLATGTATAAADSGFFTVIATVRSLGASASLIGSMQLSHNLASTGWINKAATSVSATGTFNSTTARQFLSICFTTGASVAATVRQCQVEVVTSANP